MNAIRRTALVVVVPAAEPLVADLRMQHDRMTALGVPANSTVLHPFTPKRDALWPAPDRCARHARP